MSAEICSYQLLDICSQFWCTVCSEIFLVDITYRPQGECLHMKNSAIDLDTDPFDTEDGSLYSIDTNNTGPLRKRACLHTVASHIRQSQKVHPDSAYVGTPSYNRALTAKPESDVLQAFLVYPFDD